MFDARVVGSCHCFEDGLWCFVGRSNVECWAGEASVVGEREWRLVGTGDWRLVGKSKG